MLTAICLVNERDVELVLVHAWYLPPTVFAGEQIYSAVVVPLLAHQPRAVIMDINLPGLSGFEATRRLRDWPETLDLPLIGLSAAALTKDTARARDAGFYRYLAKPVKVDELTDTLEQLLERVIGSPGRRRRGGCIGQQACCSNRS